MSNLVFVSLLCLVSFSIGFNAFVTVALRSIVRIIEKQNKMNEKFVSILEAQDRLNRMNQMTSNPTSSTKKVKVKVGGQW